MIKTPTMQDAATRDTPSETLKTLTAEISAVQQQNQTLITQNKALTEQDKKTLAQFKTDLLNDVQHHLNELKKNTESLSEKPATPLPRHNGIDEESTSTHPDGLTWVNDWQGSSVTPDQASHTPSPVSPTPAALPTSESEKITTSIPLPPRPVPYYTIPVNATLTGAVAMQPIIGRIPIDGKVTDPYAFKVIIGAKNLAANGVDIPESIQGIVASGVAQGDLLGSCARGEITSMTFVFQDGRISTKQSQHDTPLGVIASAHGNPCILGELHSNAGYYLGAQAALSGLQGYGNALSQAQLSHTNGTESASTLSQLVGNTHQYALGQGFSASAQAASKWWEQRIQNSFDFIYVPHIHPRTHQPLQLAINITQEIPIDYDPAGRKVAYPHENQTKIAAELD